MSEEERQLNKWSYEYYKERDTTSASSDYDYYIKTRGDWHKPEDEVEKDKMATMKDVLKHELRLRDIRDTYKMMGRSDILDRLQARGTCTEGEPDPAPFNFEEAEEEDMDEEFLFDPKELDI